MRTLVLRKDALTELTSDDLSAIVGGGVQTQFCETAPLMCLTAQPRCF